ncbi:hypothetical protein AAII07_20800 [Microvirga sp. 0TCS3.31]
MSDLKTNNVRGYLAEFMVAHAVGAVAPRVEWDSWDVTSPDGVRIEVKTSGYIQAWAQKKLSVPTFRVAPAYGWEASTGAWSGQQSLNAHVYVFCLHTATSHDTYDPLDTSQWKFYIASRTAVEERTTRQMGLATLRKVAGDPVTYGELGAAIAGRVEQEDSAGTAHAG